MKEFFMKEAELYVPKDNKLVKCVLCPHNCLIKENKSGICGVRKNIGGKLYSLVYGKAIASHVDPVEKKPLFHFFPGSRIYSFATAGCNFKCDFCQNYDISQLSKGKNAQIIGGNLGPETIVSEAIELGCRSIAMTYNEPTIFFEYAYDTCAIAKKKGIRTAFVSNGYISKEAIDRISPFLDAINIDLKSFREDFYKNICGGRLLSVLESIKRYHENKVWVEITTLIIPGENDSEEELEKIAGFIASVNKSIPWHISRFHPDYRMQEKKITSIVAIEKAYKIGKEAGLSYVYAGNVSGSRLENTYCPSCSKCLIKRHGYQIAENNILNGKCAYCKIIIEGLF